MEDLIHHFHALNEVERFSEQLLEDFHIGEHLFYQVLEFFGLSSLLHPVKEINLSQKKERERRSCESDLAPSLREDAVARADGRTAAAVTANRVRSLRKNTAPADCNAIVFKGMAVKCDMLDQKMSQTAQREMAK